jgi:hypothetical protein
MMKKIILLLVISVLAILVAACEPQDILPWCQYIYEEALVTYPDYPEALIGFCVASYQTEKMIAYQGLCGYEVVWDSINDGFFAEEPLNQVTSKQECLNFFEYMGTQVEW